MVKDDRLELAIKNTPKPLSLFKSIKDRYEAMSLEKIKELKQFGPKNIYLDKIHPRIAYEMTDQLCKLIKQYGCYITWFGTTQALYEMDYKGRIEQNKHISGKILSIEVARENVAINVKKELVKKNDYARYFHGFELNFAEGSIPINAITVNLEKAKSYKVLCADLKEDVEYQLFAPYCDTPRSNLTHEFGHNLFRYLEEMNALNSEIGRIVTYMFETSAEKLCIYAKNKFSEFVAEAFAESHHNPNPSIIARIVRLWIDASLEELKSLAKDNSVRQKFCS